MKSVDGDVQVTRRKPMTNRINAFHWRAVFAEDNHDDTWNLMLSYLQTGIVASSLRRKCQAACNPSFRFRGMHPDASAASWRRALYRAASVMSSFPGAIKPVIKTVLESRADRGLIWYRLSRAVCRDNEKLTSIPHLTDEKTGFFTSKWRKSNGWKCNTCYYKCHYKRKSALFQTYQLLEWFLYRVPSRSSSSLYFHNDLSHDFRIIQLRKKLCQRKHNANVILSTIFSPCYGAESTQTSALLCAAEKPLFSAWRIAAAAAAAYTVEKIRGA